MSKDVLAATIGGRRMRTIGLLAAAVLAASLVPWVTAETAKPTGWGHRDDRGEDKFLFFASDGLMQQSVEKYSGQGVTPGFRELLKRGARASDDGLLTQAPPNTGAGWFTLSTGAWPGVHGSTNNTFHKNGDTFANRTTAFDAGVLAGRDAGPSGRARRQEGRPDRVGRRSRRRHRRSDRRLPQLPFRPRRGHELHRADRQRVLHRVVRPPVRPSGWVRRPAAVRAGCAVAGRRLDRRPALVQPRAARCACGCSTAPTRDVGRQVRPQRLHL